MAAPVPLRSDFDAKALRALAKGSRDPAQIRRLLALSVIRAGGARSEAAEIGGIGLQTVRDWGMAFNADGLDGLIDGKVPGARPRLNAAQRDALKALGIWSRDVVARLITTLRGMRYGPSSSRQRHHDGGSPSRDSAT